MATVQNRLEKDYVDTYSIKEFVLNSVMPKYFPDVKTSNLTTGTIGLLGEVTSVITEDAFNAGASYLAEVFPTRSKMETSIYSNAAVFQITDMFASAGVCDFLILLSEEDVRKNLQSSGSSDYKYFYIDKDTVVRVNGPESIPFTLDYDIEIKALYKRSSGKWMYTAKYMVEEYKNSASSITDPYIRLNQLPNGMLVMKLTLKQYERTTNYETLIDNATLNYPVIVQSYTGQLLGFDVLYRQPGETEFSTQLEKKVIYSSPIKEPFCYYKPVNSHSFQISFTTKDAYFQPKFNSELKIVVYTTMAEDGEFEYFDGESYDITKGTKYDYNYSWLIAARATSGCKGGKNKIGTEGLRDLTIEGFTTANALNTENDLQTYFNNFKHRHSDVMMFVKKRNDAVELLFSAFMFIKYGDYTFPTNTLNFDTNVKLLDYKDGGFYNMDPGFLFEYKKDEVYLIPYYFVINDGDGDKYDKDGKYIDKDGNPDTTKDITLRELNRKILGGYVTETDHSYWKLPVGNADGKYHLFYSNGTKYTDVEPMTLTELAIEFLSGDLTFGLIDTGSRNMDFSIDVEAEAEARKAHLRYYETYKTEKEKPALTMDEYVFNYSIKDYKDDKNIDTRLSIFNTDVEEYAKTVDFLFTNPYIITIARDVGLVNYYQSFINNNTVLDYVKENSGQTFVQFISQTIKVERNVTSDKKYTITVNTLPSNPPKDYTEMVAVLYDEGKPELFYQRDDGTPNFGLNSFNTSLLSANNLRMILTFTYKELDMGYIELIPTGIENDVITFQAEFSTDDYISTAGTIRITHECPYCGNVITNSVCEIDTGLTYFCDKCKKEFREGILNLRELDTLELPISDAVVKLTSLYRNPEDLEHITDNDFVEFDKTYTGYMWTNLYNSMNERIALMEPLDLMRSSIEYKDYHVQGIDALDCIISDIPLLKYSVLAYSDNGPVKDDPMVSEDIGKFKYFMDAVRSNYGVLKEAKANTNGLGISLKYYNSYGRSTNFDIGEDGKGIDTNNISIYFNVWVYRGTDILESEKELKTFIKNYIESINSKGTNNLFISNLIKEIENKFAYVHHLKFVKINGYDSDYQAIINRKVDLQNLTKEERRTFVPDILVINTNNIYLSFYEDKD